MFIPPAASNYAFSALKKKFYDDPVYYRKVLDVFVEHASSVDVSQHIVMDVKNKITNDPELHRALLELHAVEGVTALLKMALERSGHSQSCCDLLQDAFLKSLTTHTPFQPDNLTNDLVRETHANTQDIISTTQSTKSQVDRITEAMQGDVGDALIALKGDQLKSKGVKGISVDFETQQKVYYMASGGFDLTGPKEEMEKFFAEVFAGKETTLDLDAIGATLKPTTSGFADLLPAGGGLLTMKAAPRPPMLLNFYVDNECITLPFSVTVTDQKMVFVPQGMGKWAQFSMVVDQQMQNFKLNIKMGDLRTFPEQDLPFMRLLLWLTTGNTKIRVVEQVTTLELMGFTIARTTEAEQKSTRMLASIYQFLLVRKILRSRGLLENDVEDLEKVVFNRAFRGAINIVYQHLTRPNKLKNAEMVMFMPVDEHHPFGPPDRKGRIPSKVIHTERVVVNGKVLFSFELTLMKPKMAFFDTATGKPLRCQTSAEALDLGKEGASVRFTTQKFEVRVLPAETPQ